MKNTVNYSSPETFSENELNGTLANMEVLSSHNIPYNLDELLNKLGVYQGKRSFLVFKNNKYTTIQTDQIAFFYIRNDSSTIMTFQSEEYSITQSMDQIQSLVWCRSFFRLNRQYIINFNAVKEVEHYFGRKLFVKLIVPCPDKLLINKEKTSAFLNWLECR
jgi:DNA-binding LytR/AlgR family response regulator